MYPPVEHELVGVVEAVEQRSYGFTKAGRATGSHVRTVWSRSMPRLMAGWRTIAIGQPRPGTRFTSDHMYRGRSACSPAEVARWVR